MAKIRTDSFEKTQVEGEKLAKTLKSGDVLALYGDLGSGKTTFTQGLVKGLGFSQRVISPTFLVVKTYQSDDPKNSIQTLYHADLYRIGLENEVKSLGLLEMMDEKDAITIIEWPEKLGERLPEKAKKITFSHISEQEREITYE